MTVLMVATVVAVVFVGAVLQRIAGMGFAMVVAPVVLIAMPDQQGVVLANLLGCAAAVLLIWPVRRDIDWVRFLLLTIGTVAGALVAVAIVGSLDIGVFRIVVGLLLFGVIVASLSLRRLAVYARSRGWAVPAGIATGALVTMSGVGGPPMTIFAVVSRWPQRSFAATMQPYAAVSAAVGATLVLNVNPASAPQLPIAIWVVFAISLLAGLVGGHLLGRIINENVGRVAVIVLGLTGTIVMIASGLVIVLAG